MQNSRDSSVWRTLAVAFGDGLAFGVGVTLTRGAARLAAANRPATPEPGPAAHQPLAASEPAQANPWNREVPQRSVVPPPAPPQLVRTAATSLPVEAALAGINRRVAETSSQIDRRLIELESRIQTELDALDEQDHALAEGVETRLDGLRGEIASAVDAQRQTIEAEMRTLRSQMATVQKEFAETIARFMDEQIARTVTARMQSMEQELRAAVREEVQAAGHGQQLTSLRDLMETQDRNMRDMVHALGETCLKVASQTAPPAPEAASDALAAGEDEVPAFARTRPRRPLWRLPVVSSFVAATGSLLLMHYL
ncbi:MAG: hypothetical protein ABI759_00650 [Candidatus Solibacter sp.]